MLLIFFSSWTILIFIYTVRLSLNYALYLPYIKISTYVLRYTFWLVRSEENTCIVYYEHFVHTYEITNQEHVCWNQ